MCFSRVIRDDTNSSISFTIFFSVNVCYCGWGQITTTRAIVLAVTGIADCIALLLLRRVQFFGGTCANTSPILKHTKRQTPTGVQSSPIQHSPEGVRCASVWFVVV